MVSSGDGPVGFALMPCWFTSKEGGARCDWEVKKVLDGLMKGIKEKWEKSYGEGTQFDLDYGKLLILGLCIYIAIKVS
jgi:hypothetical protein